MSETTPAISVIVPAWGVAHLVGEALDSLRAQSFTDWEAIVVDDGAPDDVAGAVAPFVAADPRIRFLATPHGGLSAARNRAIVAARAPLIALLDGDDAYAPGYLRTMVAAIGGDHGLGFVTCDATFVGGTERDGRLFSASMAQAGEPTLEAVLARRFHVLAAATIRREAIAAVGGFDETLAAAEDLDLWIRILERGWRGGYVARPLVRYRRRRNSLSAATGKLRVATRIVYERAEGRLAGRPEQAVARAMVERMRAETGWVEGEVLILAGRVREGIELLRRSDAGRQSARWRWTMRLFAVAPFLARPLLAWRARRDGR